MTGYRLSGQQKQLVHARGTASLVSQCIIRLSGQVDESRLREACLRAVRSHEILRTTFVTPPGMRDPFQVVNDDLLPAWGDDIALDPEKGPVVHFRLSEQYELTVTALALCSDALGLQHLVREILGILHGSSEGSGERLQYADYSEWQNELRASGDAEASGYWSGCCLPAVPLPFALSGENVPKPDRVEIVFDSGVQDIEARATDAGLNAEEFLLSVWISLIGRMTDREEVPVQVATDGRTAEETQTAPGPFRRVLPLRVSPADVKAQLTKGREYQEFLPVHDEAPCSPGFSFLPVLPGLPVLRLSEAAYGASVVLECEWSPERGSARILFDSAVNLPEDMRALLHDWASLVRGSQLLTSVDNSAAGPAPEVRFHELFEAQAERFPDRPALVFEPFQYSYRELNKRANQLAHHLMSVGVRAGSRVGLWLPRSADSIIGMLAVLKAGGAYVPFHPDLPVAMALRQLSDVGAIAVFTVESMLPRLAAFEGQIVCMDRETAQICAAAETNPVTQPDPDGLAYIIFTSGSTGIPKGVEIRHSGVVNYTQSLCAELGAAAPDDPGMQYANLTSFAADLGNTTIFCALASGGCLHIIPEALAQDGALYAARCAQHPIDVVKTTPSHLAALLDAGDPKFVLPRRTLITGGELLPWDLAKRVLDFGFCSLLNHYGPTEATVGCLTFPVENIGTLSRQTRGVPLGRPLANTVICILDDQGQPVPRGVAGELLVGGAGIARGYVNRPEATAERFIPDPLNRESGRIFYRTGDRVRYLSDYTVEFLGRNDDQVKIRGYRVEPGEVEAVLARSPQVTRAAVCTVENTRGDRSLAAFVVAAGRPAASGLRDFLREQLPEYMLPAQLHFVESIPLTGNGKVDRKALLDGIPRQLTAATAERRAATPTEARIAQIWSEVLAIPLVGVDDNFFELGGHSLLAIQVIVRIRAAFQMEIPLRAIFEAPTVGGLAQQIAAGQDKTEDDELARLLAEVAHLSDDALQRLLDETN